MNNHKYASTYKILATSITLILSGCMGVYEGGFECPPGEGTRCKSISEVNEMVNKEVLPKASGTIISKEDCETCHHKLSQDALNPTKGSSKIWIAPWAAMERD